MRTILMLVLAVALGTLSAQPAQAQGFTAGVKGGIDLADLGGNLEEEIETSTDLKLGYSAGAFFGVDLHRLFRLGLEGQYVRKGASAEEGGVEADFNVDYIELMLPATLLIPIESGPVVPRLYAGPAIAFETSCKIQVTEGGTTEEFDCTDPEFDAPTKSTDFGLFFGGGLDILVGSGAITFDVLYNIGLTNIADDPTGQSEVKNRNLQFLVGYGFRFGA